MHPRWLLPVLVTLVGCSLPRRDNPNDPVNSPEAVLRTRAVEPGADCLALAPLAASWPDALESSRGGCVALDARGSVDTHGEPGGLRFEFSLTEPFQVALDVESGALVFDSAGLAVLAPAFLRTLPVDVPLSFRMRARDGSASRATSGGLILRNARPVANAGPVRVLPPGGFPESPGAHIAPFDGSRSFDPDGDALEYCWYFPFETPPPPTLCADTAADPAFGRPIASREGRYAGVLTVRDDLGLTSAPAWTSVDVRDPDLWVSTDLRVTLAESRIGPILDATGAVLVSPSLLAGFFDDGAVERMVRVNGSTLELVAADGLSIDATAPAGSSPSALRVDSMRDNVWTIDGGFVRPWKIAPPVFSALAPPVLANSGVAQAVDASGRLWGAPFVFQPAPVISVVDTAGNVTAVEQPPGLSAIALSPRPGTAEMWALSVGTSSMPSSGALVRYDATGIPQTVVEGPELADATLFAWLGPTDFWLMTRSDGLSRVDAARLEMGGTLEDATILTLDEVGSTYGASPRWVVDGAGTIRVYLGLYEFVVDPDGETNLHYGLTCDSPALDRTGLVACTYDPDPTDDAYIAALWRGPAGREYSRSRLVPGRIPGVEARDPTTGGLWAPTTDGALSRIWPDGTVEAHPSCLAPCTGGAAAPALSALSVSSRGGYAWGRTATGFFRLNLDARPIVLTPVGSSLPPGLVSFASSADGSFLWVTRTGVAGVETLDTGGNLALAIPLPGAEVATSPAKLARTASGALCILTEWTDVGPTEKRTLRRATDGASPVALGDLIGASPLTTTWSPHASQSHSSDSCWATRRNGFGQGAVVRFAGPGAVQEVATTTIIGAAPFGDDIWIVRLPAVLSQVTRLERFRFLPGVAIPPVEALEETDARRLP